MNALSVHALSKQNTPYYKELLSDVAGAERLTVVAGAGVSIDAGLPDWLGLVRTVLETGLRSAGQEPYEELAAKVLESTDVLGAATLARMVQTDRDQAIRSALYEHQPNPLSPGRVARSLAHLCRIFDGKIRFITTNYDDLIEEAIRAEGEFAPRSRFIDRDGHIVDVDDDPSDGSVEVIHLHGFMPRGVSDTYGSVILDERDYAVEPVRPPGPVMPELLSIDEPTLFVGLSFTDPNLLAACYDLRVTPKSRRPWHGLFIVSEDSVPELIELKRQRIQDLGVRPFSLVSFGQVSQVIYEMALCAEIGVDEYFSDSGRQRYGLRLTDWRNSFLQRHPGVLGGDDYAQAHAAIHDRLKSYLQIVRGSEVHDLVDAEHLGVHFWVRRPSESPGLGWLQLVGSSANLHSEPWSLQLREEPVRHDSVNIAVNSLYYGGTHRRDLAKHPGRWNASIASPIELQEEPHKFILVGVVTLSSTNVLKQSVLDRPEAFLAVKRLKDLLLQELL